MQTSKGLNKKTQEDKFMDNANEYAIASLPKDKIDSITELEAKLKSQFNMDVVLVAYQKK